MVALTDHSAALIDPQAIKDTGYACVVDYFSESRPSANVGAKTLRRDYCDRLRALGLDIVCRHSSIGAHPIPDMLWVKYEKLGWDADALGHPVADRTVLNGPDGQPRVRSRASRAGVPARRQHDLLGARHGPRPLEPQPLRKRSTQLAGVRRDPLGHRHLPRVRQRPRLPDAGPDPGHGDRRRHGPCLTTTRTPKNRENPMKKVLMILRSEPVRTLLYPLLVALIGYGVTKGFVSSDSSGVIVAVLAAALGIPAVESARGRVVPTPPDSGEVG